MSHYYDSSREQVQYLTIDDDLYEVAILPDAGWIGYKLGNRLVICDTEDVTLNIYIIRILVTPPVDE